MESQLSKYEAHRTLFSCTVLYFLDTHELWMCLFPSIWRPAQKVAMIICGQLISVSMSLPLMDAFLGHVGHVHPVFYGHISVTTALRLTDVKYVFYAMDDNGRHQLPRHFASGLNCRSARSSCTAESSTEELLSWPTSKQLKMWSFNIF